MRLFSASIAAGFLLLASLSLKVAASGPDDATNTQGTETAVVAAMKDLGFSTRYEDNWILGVREECEVYVGEVEPQGWSRSSIRRAAEGRPVFYTFDGVLYDEQPILRSSISHYVHRLKAYFFVTMPGGNTHAILTGRRCPADFRTVLEALAVSM